LWQRLSRHLVPRIILQRKSPSIANLLVPNIVPRLALNTDLMKAPQSMTLFSDKPATKAILSKKRTKSSTWSLMGPLTMDAITARRISGAMKA